MDPRAITKAKARLASAEKALARLAETQTASDFAEEWYALLVASKNVWTTLEAGAKSAQKSKEWFGRQLGRRRADRLLTYMFEARNDEEHGLDDVIERHPGGVQGYVQAKSADWPVGFSSSGVSIGRAGDITLMGTDAEGRRMWFVPGTTFIRNVHPHMQLKPVSARGRVVPPPQDDPPDPFLPMAPAKAARLNQDHLTNMVGDAEKLTPA